MVLIDTEQGWQGRPVESIPPGSLPGISPWHMQYLITKS